MNGASPDPGGFSPWIAPALATVGLGALAITSAMINGADAPWAIGVLGIVLGGTLAGLGLWLRHQWIALAGIAILYVWYWPWLPAIGYPPIIHSSMRAWVLIPLAAFLLSYKAHGILNVWGNVFVVLLGISLLFDTGLVLLGFFVGLHLGGDAFFIPWAMLHYFFFPLLVAILCLSLAWPSVWAYFRSAQQARA